MKTLVYLVAAAVIAIPAAYLANRSVSARAASPTLSAPPRAAAFNVPDQPPLDADYMVPGVLDDRSWKPEYDRMPPARAAVPARRLVVAVHRPLAVAGQTAEAPAITLPTEAPSIAPAPTTDVPQS